MAIPIVQATLRTLSLCALGLPLAVASCGGQIKEDLGSIDAGAGGSTASGTSAGATSSEGGAELTGTAGEPGASGKASTGSGGTPAAGAGGKPTVVPPPPLDAGLPCLQEDYVKLRIQLETKYLSSGCSSDTDCVIVPISGCGSVNCGTALPSTLASSFTENLSSFAAANCGGCSHPDIACMPGAFTAICSSGVCKQAD